MNPKGRPPGRPGGANDLERRIKDALFLATGNRMTLTVWVDAEPLVRWGERLLASSDNPCAPRVRVRPTPINKRGPVARFD